MKYKDTRTYSQPLVVQTANKEEATSQADFFWVLNVWDRRAIKKGNCGGEAKLTDPVVEWKARRVRLGLGTMQQGYGEQERDEES